jgi:peptidoglycan/xylan/chitin deacetylase (PgdA/CDA1 family)
MRASLFVPLLVSMALLTGAAARAESPSTGRAVAITIDDLPRGGDRGPSDLASLQAMTARLLQPFREQRIPVMGFVNGGRYPDDEPGLKALLEQWLDAGAELGNHSHSHFDINSVPLAQYTADITRGEEPLRSVLAARGQRLSYYRHPYLHVGATPEAKAGLASFLAAKGYTVAPVTLDNADYAYAASYLRPEDHERAQREYLPYMESVVAFFEARSVEVVGREFPQILLMHANQLNADQMPALLAMFKRRGYRFVSVAEALRDPVYQSPERYVGRGGFSWIHRWSQARGLPNRGEPDPPDWVMKGF